MLHEESDVACLELQRLVAQNFRVGEHVSIERAGRIHRALCIPFEATNANLESVHPGAIVFELLVTIFHLIERMHLVLEANCQSRELCVQSDEICGLN